MSTADLLKFLVLCAIAVMLLIALVSDEITF